MIRPQRSSSATTIIPSSVISDAVVEEDEEDQDCAMEIDPIDDGPVLLLTQPHSNTSGNSSTGTGSPATTTTTNMTTLQQQSSSSSSPYFYQSYPPVYGTSTTTTTAMNNNNNNNNNKSNSVVVVPTAAAAQLLLSPEETKHTIDQLRSDDVNLRILATQYIPAICQSLQSERTRTELFPFLIDGIDDDDEVLLAVATALQQIPDIISIVGGYSYIAIVLRLVELLCSIEDISVREAAIHTAQSILQQIIAATPIQAPTTTTTLPSGETNTDMDDNDIVVKAQQQQQQQQDAFLEYVDMVRRLASKEWFTARISAAILIASPSFFCYRAPGRHDNTNKDNNDDDYYVQQELLLPVFVSLCRDETPMVRRVAAQQLGSMVRNIVQVFGRQLALQHQPQQQHQPESSNRNTAVGNIILRTIVPLYEEIAASEQPDAVRLQTTENCVAFGQVMSDIILRQQQSNNNKISSSNANERPGRQQVLLHDDEIVLLQKIVPLIVATVDDRSWRVRWTAAAKFAQVIMAYDAISSSSSSYSNNNVSNSNNNSTSFIMDTLIPAYEKLLQDPEAEVRTAATFNLALVAQCQSRVPLVSSPPVPISITNITNTSNRTDGGMIQNGSSTSGGVHHLAVASMAGTSNTSSNSLQQQHQRVSVAERLVKRITSLTEDDSEHVRAALAMVATELAPVLGKDATITYLVPPVLLLLRDAASEVRLNLMSSLSSLNSVIGVDLLSQSLLPAILDLAQDGKWRIRLAIIQHIPLLAEQLGREFFTERLTPLCVGWLGDDIASIRHAAASNLMELTKLFGTEWAIENLLPPIVEIREHESYLRRLTALKACSMMATAMDAETARQQLLPVILDMATDVVPNIRFNVAKELRNIAIACGASSYETLILPILNMLSEDDDRDVRFYAELSLNVLDEEFATVTK